MGDVQIEFPDACMEHLGHLNQGKLKITGDSAVFKNSATGKLETVPASKFDVLSWTRLANQPALRISLDDGTMYRFGKFSEREREKLESFAQRNWHKEIKKEEMAVKGWNWGKPEFKGARMDFQIDGKNAFSIPLSNVSGASGGKHEAVLEFHQNEDCQIGLVEMRFHMAPLEGDDDNEQDRLQDFIDKVMEHAGVVKDTDKPLCVLDEVMCNPPRGRYEIKMFPNHLSFHGKSFDYKVPVKSIMRLFLLPHKDGKRMFFVIGLDPPIRQGVTRYHYIVLEFNKEDDVDVEITATDEQMKERYEGKLQRQMSGPKYEIVSRIMRALVNQRITVPGTFQSASGHSALTCAYKSSSGFLYPLEKGFVYVNKPPMYIRYEEVTVVHFARSDVSTRSFDFEVELNNGNIHVFNSVEKDEYSRLFDFVSKKNLKIRNAKQSAKAASIIDEFAGSDEDDERDHYKERLKKEAEEDEEEDSESEDEDFDPEAKDRSDSASEDSELSEEYDSNASGSDG